MTDESFADQFLSERDVAQILFKDACKPTSWKTIQKLARQGKIRGKKVGRGWMFHKEAINDFLLRK